MTMVFGIDLGTTNCCISRYHDGKFDVIPINGGKTVPSVVAHDGQKWLVGREAVNHLMLHPEDGVRSVKRHMGNPDFRFEVAGVSLSATEISALILKYLAEQVERDMNVNVEEVVITVPAWFNDHERQATISAGEQASLKVVRIINEPTAAALAYDVVVTNEDATKATQHWLVYDLGGGTFDVSVLKVQDGYKEVLASCGNVYLGGDDFDQLILAWLLTKLKDQYNIDFSKNIAVGARLRYAAEQAKMVLSTEAECEIIEVFEVDGTKFDLRTSLSREKFESMIRDYVDSTIAKVEQALSEAHLAAPNIDRLFLVGGSTRIPMIRERLAELFHLAPDIYIDPDLSVALGASVQAAVSMKLTFDQIIVDVAPHTLGIAALGSEDFDPMSMLGLAEHTLNVNGHPFTFAPMIKRNSSLPARFAKVFRTSADNQTVLEVGVYQGESKLSTENNFVGSFTAGINGGPAGSPIYIEFEYDLNGIIHVSVRESALGKATKRYTMSLLKSAHENSEVSIDQNSINHEDDGDTGSMNNINNFLIEKVSAKLSECAGQDIEHTSAILEAYKKALSEADDEALDGLEEQLYDWLKVQNNAAAT